MSLNPNAPFCFLGTGKRRTVRVKVYGRTDPKQKAKREATPARPIRRPYAADDVKTSVTPGNVIQ